MSCPELRLHAHGRKPSEPPPPRRGYGLGIIIAWVASFGSHAGVAAWILLAVPFTEPVVDRGVSFGIEIVIESAPQGSEVSSPSPTSASIPSMTATSETTLPVEPVASVAPATPATESKPTEATPITESPSETVPPVARPPRRTQSPVSDREPPRVAAQAEESPAGADPVVAPVSADQTASLSAPAASGARLKVEDAAPRAGNRSPEYPAYAHRRGIEGRVVLIVDVNADGTVAGVAVAESSSHDTLDLAAVEAVRKWLFHPGRRDGIPIESQVKVPIAFRLVGR